MLDFPREIKELFLKDNISPATHKNLKLIFYKNKTQALYPRENLYPEETLYPAEHNMEEDVLMVIENNQIESESLTITESLSESENLEFGSCNSAMVEIVVADVEEDLTGKEFELVVCVGGYEVLLGMYMVKSFVRQADRTKRKITAYDRMKWFDEDVAGWYETLKFPMALSEFRSSLCAFVGIQEEKQILINDEMIVEKTIKPESLLGIDVLKCICQINGVFGNISKEGKMRYISAPKKDDFQGTIKTYKAVEYEEYMVPDIDTVKIQKEEGDIGGTSTGGDDVNTYIIEGNFLVYGKTTAQMIEIANNVLSNITDLEYRPATIEISGSPWYEIGDRLRAITSDGDVNTIITRRTFKGIQKMMDTLKSTGSAELKRTFNIRTQITEAKGLTAILKRTVEEVSNNLTNLEEQTNSKFTQTAEQIKLEVERAKKEEGQLKSSITQTAEQIALKVSKGEVTSQLNSELKITGNSIALTTGHFTINAKNMTLDKNGNATFSGSISGGSINIGNGQFTVDTNGNVVAKSITASTSNASDLRGIHIIVTGTVSGNYLDIRSGGTLSGTYDIDTIYSNDVWGQIHDTSDARLKKNVNHINSDIAIKIIKELNPVSFLYKKNDSPGMGFIAQEVKGICDKYGIELPLYEINRGIYSITYTNFISLIISVLQEIMRRMDGYENSNI